MEQKILGVASKITRPMSLASLVVIALYLIYRSILGMGIFTSLSENNVFALITSIVDRVFYLSLVSLVLGIISFSLVSYFNAQRRLRSELTITGHVFFSTGKPIKGATVFVEGMDRRKETDATGWFSIAVNEQESWTVHAIYDEQATETEIGKENVNRPIRLIIPTQESDKPFSSPRPAAGSHPANVMELLKDPVPFLRLIKQHLSKQPAGRDYLEPIVDVIGSICENDLELAGFIFQQLVHEQYLVHVAGDRYELSLKAQNALAKGGCDDKKGF